MEGESSNNSPSEDTSGIRLVTLNLPEDEGEGLGFRLTRTLWDPYPWVREVTPGARADAAGLKAGDCLLQVDGKDLLGMPVGQVAGVIRGDGAGRGVSLLVWSCGVDPRDDPELLWSCGGGSRGERARRALGGVVRALACCVCASTAAKPLVCARSHLYCEACWSRLERCALCREPLPAKESPYARNLVAEQVFEAIATEYEIKDTMKRITQTSSARTSPNRSPVPSPSVQRRGNYQLSMMHRKKAVQFTEKFGQNYASDPNIHRSLNNHETRRINSQSNGNTECNCQKKEPIPQIRIEDTESNYTIPHKLVAKLRQACSMADLQSSGQNNSGHCLITKSLNNVSVDNSVGNRHSMENINANCGTGDTPPVFILSAQPIYVLACDHKTIE